MNKDLHYNGYTAQPSDYQSPDGDLSLNLNLINENGSLHPVFQPSPVADDIGSPDDILYIHKTSFVHYITYGDGQLNWVNPKENKNAVLMKIERCNVRQVTSIGNTLIVLAPDGMHYFLWKADTANYLYLGTHLPECPLSFGLQGHFHGSASFNITFDNIGYTGSGTTATDPFCALFTDANKDKITTQVLAQVNKFIAESSTATGKFIFPFFVRYAYRLYDGSLTMHSAPILMMASTDVTPEAAVTSVPGPPECASCNITLYVVQQSLDYAVINPSAVDELKKWGDIISSIDIFVSKPIYTYDQNGQCIRFEVSQDSDTYTVCKLTNQGASVDAYPPRYQKHKMHEIYALHFNNFATIYRYRVALPKKSQDVIKEEIKNVSNFYLLDSIKIDNLKTERTVINVKEDYLQSLLTREVMTDDYDSHDRLIAGSAFVYNGRLNISNITKRLYDSYNTGAMVQYSDGYTHVSSDASSSGAFDSKAPYTVYFHIHQDGKELVVGGEAMVLAGNNRAPMIFLFYPNTNAYKATIVTSISNMPWAVEVPLEKHAMLNGSFYFSGWDNPVKAGLYRSSAPPALVDLPNKVYQSEVNNPFYFPLLGINTVGTGEIRGICAAVKALSQGQFGQFPLYAFTDEGVWAMELSSTGTYSAKQPVTRDVVVSAGSITQLDSAVLFATERGIMLISGSQTQCLTDIIDTDYPFDSDILPGFRQLDGVGELLPSIMPFRNFLNGCRMVYDYTNQRIIIFRPDITYAYVYSMKSKMWGMMECDLKSAVNSYPDAYAVTNDGKLVNLSVPDLDNPPRAILVTRPLKLDAPDIYKTIDTVIQRGGFRRGHVQSILYGSRDLQSWHLVWSSRDHFMRGFRGTPYKYFRIALLCDLAPDETLAGASIQYTPRLANRPR